MRGQQGIRPQDILVLLKLVASEGKEWRQMDLARELGLSQYEISVSLERARFCGLLDGTKKQIMRVALLEFLIHGVKYAFPAEPGPVCRGIPTSHSAPPISKHIVSEKHDQYVWPSDDGTVRGQAISPLYKSVPFAAQRDPKLHDLLAMVDALRVGRARERQMAREELERRLLGNRQSTSPAHRGTSGKSE